MKSEGTPTPKLNKYHCCATCIHFKSERVDGRIITICVRLEYQTRPEYRFNCWNPKSSIRAKMQAEKPQ